MILSKVQVQVIIGCITLDGMIDQQVRSRRFVIDISSSAGYLDKTRLSRGLGETKQKKEKTRPASPQPNFGRLLIRSDCHLIALMIP